MAIHNPFRPLFDKIPAPMRNRYFLCLVLFIAWMVFFDKHDVLTNVRLQQSLDKLERDEVYYQNKIKEADLDKKDMESNKEKFAREHYFLQKSDEDVFIIVEEETQ